MMPRSFIIGRATETFEQVRSVRPDAREAEQLRALAIADIKRSVQVDSANKGEALIDPDLLSINREIMKL